MKKLLLNVYVVASLCLNPCAGHGEAIGTDYAFGRQSLTEVGSLMGPGDILSGVLPRTPLLESASNETQISSWASPISQGTDKELSTSHSGCDTMFVPPSNVVLRSAGKPERTLKVAEPPPLFIVGTGLLGIIALHKVNRSDQDTRRIVGFSESILLTEKREFSRQ